ncbi:hypothetical protein MASR1M101_35990 [Gemmatimonas sp.]
MPSPHAASATAPATSRNGEADVFRGMRNALLTDVKLLSEAGAAFAHRTGSSGSKFFAMDTYVSDVAHAPYDDGFMDGLLHHNAISCVVFVHYQHPSVLPRS